MTKKLHGYRPQRNNANKHKPFGLNEIDKSIRRDGWMGAITTAADGETFAGSARLEKAADIFGTDIEPIVVESDGSRPVIVVRTDIENADDPRAKRLGVADNLIAKLDYSPDGAILAQLAAEDDLIAQLVKADEDSTNAILASVGDEMPPEDGGAARPTLADRFGVPPFSVLDARQGYWQTRKRAWLELGIQSEIGRGGTASTSARSENPTYREIKGGKSTYNDRDWIKEKGLDGLAQDTHIKPDNGLLGFSEQARSHYKKANATPGGSPMPATKLGKDGKTQRGDGAGRPFAQTFGSGAPGDLAAGFKETASLQGGLTFGTTTYPYRREESASPQTGTSIFDPVLCELAYKWFCPKASKILDPFAGGSVRGVVAALLGHDYTGIDLRQEQIDANVAQAHTLTPDRLPRWITGDSRNAATLAPDAYDFVFSCPPYFDLELYSEDEHDLSNAGDYAEFLVAYRDIIKQACAMLKDNRFACFVVGDLRDKAGFYRNFPADTISAFMDAGMQLYNEAILVTAVGSLPIRVGRQFEGYRKLGKTHQNVLVFYKGDPKAIRDFGAVEFGELETIGQFGVEYSEDGITTLE